MDPLILFHKIKSFLITAIAIGCISGCNYRDDYNSQPDYVQGYVPVYLDSAEFVNGIVSQAPRSLSVVGGVYLYKMYMLVVEEGVGIHVFDNSDTTLAPVPFCFIQVPYVNSLSVKNDILYVQNILGLVFIDISNLPNIQVLGIITHPGPVTHAKPPVGSNFWGITYFECPEEGRGRIIRWEQRQLNKPKCNMQNF